MLIERSLRHLKEGGRLFIGDIPDMDRKWAYISRPEYKKDYFERVRDSRPKIGYWFQRDFFAAMQHFFDGTKVTILDQPTYQINADHCFDVLIQKVNNA